MVLDEVILNLLLRPAPALISYEIRVLVVTVFQVSTAVKI
jgi:hypothetical protein